MFKYTKHAVRVADGISLLQIISNVIIYANKFIINLINNRRLHPYFWLNFGKQNCACMLGGCDILL